MEISPIPAGATQRNVAVSGTVAIYYTLTAGNDGNGSVTLNPTGGTYASGTTVTLTPVPTPATSSATGLAKVLCKSSTRGAFTQSS